MVWLYHILFIHSSVYGHLGYVYFGNIMDNIPKLNAVTNIHIHFEFMSFFGEHMFSVLLGRSLGMDILAHMVTLCLTF